MQCQGLVLFEDIRPDCAHIAPVGAGVVPVFIARREIVIDDALIAVDAEFLGQIGQVRLAHDQFVIFLFLHPAARHDGVAVVTFQHLVVIAHGMFAPRQGTPCLGADPGGEVGLVFPAAVGFIARRVIDLIDRLRPATLDHIAGQFSVLPGVVADIFQYCGFFILPVLAPVFHHHRPRKALVLEVHDHNVLQADKVAPVFHHIDIFGAPGLVGRMRAETGRVAGHFDEVEAGAVRPGHGQDGAPVSFKVADAGRLEAQPARVRLGVQGSPGSAGGPAARPHAAVFNKRPAKGGLAAVSAGAVFAGLFVGVNRGDEHAAQEQIQAGSGVGYFCHGFGVADKG